MSTRNQIRDVGMELTEARTLSDKSSQLLDKLCNLRLRISANADEFMGMRAEKNVDAPAVASPNGIIPATHFYLDQMVNVIDDCHSILNRTLP